MCDRTKWGVELCKRVGSPHFKLLYDIYHMQIMEGDVIRTMQTTAYIGHFHTGGNPGRQRNRRHAGTQLQSHRESCGRNGFRWILRARVHTQAPAIGVTLGQKPWTSATFSL